MTYIPAHLRRQVMEQSGDCRIHQNDSGINHHIEHIVAISHGGQTTAGNLAYSCARCNLHKGANIAAADPATSEPTFLFHPRRQNWHDHFQLSGDIIEPRTPEGRATVFVLRLNDQIRILQRNMLSQIGRYPCTELD